MKESLEIAANAYSSYARYLWHEITHPAWGNYVYWLLVVSVVFFLLECLRPWRKDQPRFRKDFWLDAFYMVFNFFLFSLIIYNAASEVVVNWFQHGLSAVGVQNLPAIEIASWPAWAQLITLFIVRDFAECVGLFIWDGMYPKVRGGAFFKKEASEARIQLKKIFSIICLASFEMRYYCVPRTGEGRVSR